MKTWLGISNNKVKDRKGFTGKENHNLRHLVSSNVDPEQIHKDRELISLNGKTMNQAFRARINQSDYYKDHDIADNAVWGFEVTLGLGEPALRHNETGEYKELEQLPKGFDEEEWLNLCVDWMKEKYGEENIISAVLHKDENALAHIHFIIVPVMNDEIQRELDIRWREDNADKYDPDKGIYVDEHGNEMKPPVYQKGKLNGSKTIGFKKEYSRLVHEYNDWMVKRYGFDKIEDKTYDQGGYEDIRDYKRAIRKEKSYTLPEPLEHEPVMVYYERAQEAFQMRNLQALGERNEANKTIKQLEHQISEQNIQQAKTAAELERLQSLTGNMEENKKAKRAKEAIDVLKEGVNSFPDKAYADTIISGLGHIYEHAVTKSGRYDLIDELDDVINANKQSDDGKDR